MQWLYSLGVTVVDWKNLTLTFSNKDKQICIKGDPSLTKSRVSLRNLLKMWEEHDHGYLIECRSIAVASINETDHEERGTSCETKGLITTVLD